MLSHYTTQPYQLVNTIVYNSLDIFHRSFLGSIPGIWHNEVLICQDGQIFGWQTVLKDIQHVINYNVNVVFIVKNT